MMLPTEAKARKDLPIASGVLDYFPAALTAVAELSRRGNDQHNPGQRLFWNREKSGDEADALLRHFIERGTFDSDGVRHSAKVAWRALALLQKELEDAGAPLSRGSIPPPAVAAARLTIISPETGDSAEVDALDAFCSPQRPCWVCRGEVPRC